MTSTPNMAYQQNYSPVYSTHPLPPYPPPPPMSPGIDSVLKEICQKLSNVETKLTKLDKIFVDSIPLVILSNFSFNAL
jgi:hypothetical protein